MATTISLFFLSLLTLTSTSPIDIIPIDTSPALSLVERALWGSPQGQVVRCANIPLPDPSTYHPDLPVTYESTSDLCYANTNINAGCACKKVGDLPVVWPVQCTGVQITGQSKINDYCLSACTCVINPNPQDGFVKSPNYFKGTKCKQWRYDETVQDYTQTPVYCLKDEACGEGCVCNGREDHFYISGGTTMPSGVWGKSVTMYSQLQIMFGLRLQDDLGVCGEKIKFPGPDGIGWPVGGTGG
ncbi:MAG: hypothetical protein M1836_001613 [Candelina mexicana]|nr:MAG: hypothetical protein M1836_001613 [Candelina mexicana]